MLMLQIALINVLPEYLAQNQKVGLLPLHVFCTDLLHLCHSTSITNLQAFTCPFSVLEVMTYDQAFSQCLPLTALFLLLTNNSPHSLPSIADSLSSSGQHDVSLQVRIRLPVHAITGACHYRCVPYRCASLKVRTATGARVTIGASVSVAHNCHTGAYQVTLQVHVRLPVCEESCPERC